MTNAQINLEAAIEALEAGMLTDYEANFIDDICYYNKKQLRTLTAKQYKLLVQCANKCPE